MKSFFRRCKNSVERRYKDYCWKKKIKNATRKENEIPVRDELVIFDTSINSLNMGDVIIQHYCRKVIDEVFAQKKKICIPTHFLATKEKLDLILGVKNKIVCGTNLITPHYEEYSGWKMPEDLYGYSNIVTLGVGWGYYCEDISTTSRTVYNTILSKKSMHSVRDNYTMKKFKEMGINNVVNTGCPTLWALNSEHCAKIPSQKAKNVITTITDYDRNEVYDRLMLEILLEKYEKVSVWIQGTEDFDYLKELINLDLFEIIPRDFDLYTEALNAGDVDYIGTRLHAGIHALNQGVRSLIVAIDNRAIEMARDVNLPIILRDCIGKELIEKIDEQRKTEIILPEKEIVSWKLQFALNE